MQFMEKGIAFSMQKPNFKHTFTKKNKNDNI